MWRLTTASLDRVVFSLRPILPLFGDVFHLLRIVLFFFGFSPSIFCSLLFRFRKRVSAPPSVDSTLFT